MSNSMLSTIKYVNVNAKKMFNYLISNIVTTCCHKSLKPLMFTRTTERGSYKLRNYLTLWDVGLLIVQNSG